jgi:hypothetical protein
MWNNADVAPLDRRYAISVGAATNIAGCTHSLMAEEPDRIETWMRQFPSEPVGFMSILTVTDVNGKYAEKIVTLKRFPSLYEIAEEKIAGRDKMSFGHVIKDRCEVSVTYFGNVVVGRQVRITDISGAQTRDPILMKLTAKSELADWIPLDATFDTYNVIPGYEHGNLANDRLKDMLEEEMETLLYDNGFVFAEDGKSYHELCVDCGEYPCVWDDNQPTMVAFDACESNKDKQPNQRRHGLYRQMALIMNDGPSGKGNRLKLPNCVLVGVRALFPDPDEVYTGHREVGGLE